MADRPDPSLHSSGVGGDFLSAALSQLRAQHDKVGLRVQTAASLQYGNQEPKSRPLGTVNAIECLRIRRPKVNISTQVTNGPADDRAEPHRQHPKGQPEEQDDPVTLAHIHARANAKSG
jgi:hypothetical protein